MDPSEYFAGSPLGLAVHHRLLAVLGPYRVQVRSSRSQVAYRRRRAFAWLWFAGRYLAHPSAELVLSVALGRHDPSPRFKEVAHPSRAHWFHHLEVGSAEDLDEEVAGWLREAAERAG
jgi:hypothetical protein